MNFKKPIFAAFALGMIVLSSTAHAVESAAITSAFTSANANLTTVVGGVIALAAVATGVGLIFKFLAK